MRIFNQLFCLCYVTFSVFRCNHGSFQFACRSSANRRENRSDFLFKDVRDRVQSIAEYQIEYPLQDGSKNQLWAVYGILLFFPRLVDEKRMNWTATCVFQKKKCETFPVGFYSCGQYGQCINIPRTQMTLVLIEKGLVLEGSGWPSKIEVSWVPGVYYIYIHIICTNEPGGIQSSGGLIFLGWTSYPVI